MNFLHRPAVMAFDHRPGRRMARDEDPCAALLDFLRAKLSAEDLEDAVLLVGALATAGGGDVNSALEEIEARDRKAKDGKRRAMDSAASVDAMFPDLASIGRA